MDSKKMCLMTLIFSPSQIRRKEKGWKDKLGMF